MKERKITKTALLIGISVLLILAVLAVTLIVGREDSKKKEMTLGTYWTEDSAAAQSLREYVAKVTDPADKDSYIPVKDRIAVFDMDGTLTCETYYTYYDTMMFIEYCLHDHPEKVTDELKQIAADIRPGYLADENLARNFARAYAGMTVEEFSSYVTEFGKKETASFTNMRYIDNFYLPMTELVKYLYDNDFTIYVISGTERTTTRAIVANSPIRDYVTPNHVIGTAFEVKQAGYENEPSNMNFKYENGDELVITGGFIQKNLNGNKSIWIEREIGQRPVLAFGNSGSDTSMMNYTIDSRNPYPAQAYMVVADDDVREWGKQDWETKSADYRAKGYVPISMKNDFAQIYAEGITPADSQFQERDWSDADWFNAPVEEWTRQGAFEDENGNHLIVNLSETEGYEGWAVSLILDGDPVGWILSQEGAALRGNLNAWDETAEPFNVVITEEGEDGLQLEVEGGKTFHFTPVELPKATITATVNTEGWGQIAYAEGEETPEFDPEFPAQSAYIALAEPAVHTFAAEAEAGNLFVKWTKNGEDFSTEPQITLLLDESADYVAVFEEDPDWQNPVMNFVGNYQCDRARAGVECFGFDEAFITVEWASSASELTRWIIVGRLDSDTQTIHYTGASKANLVYDEQGDVVSEESVYDDGTGTITFREDGSFTWHEDSSERGEDLVFEWIPVTADASVPEAADASMANPWTDADSAQAAADAAGLGSLTLPKAGTETAGGPIDWDNYRYMDLLAEANGYVGAAELTVRKGVNRPAHEVAYDTADVSGDYNSYAHEWTIEAGGWQVRCFGNEDGRTMKAVWASDNFSYCILVRGQGDIRDSYGLGSDDVASLVAAIA